MGGMKVSNMDFIKLLPAFMQDDEAAIALSKAVNKLIGEPGKRLATIRTWVSTTALNVKASTASKSVKKTTNTAAKKATKKTIKVGDYVKPTGSRYATGQKIPNWVKQRKHRVSQIKSSQNKVLLGHPNGINSWVYLSEVTLA